MTVSKQTQDLLDKFRAVLPKAEANGKVLTFEEACEKYVSEQWHEGKIENMLEDYNITEEELDEIRKRGYYLSEYLQIRGWE